MQSIIMHMGKDHGGADTSETCTWLPVGHDQRRPVCAHFVERRLDLALGLRVQCTGSLQRPGGSVYREKIVK